MSEVKHTQGRWFTTSENGGSKGTTVWAGAGNILIAKCGDSAMSLSGRQANARLIAAAPELLEALENIFRELAWDQLPPAKRSLADNARAAIAKATGSTK